MDNISILIVDDHPMMREALFAALEDEPDLNVVAEATNASDALTVAAKCNPDVVLMDLLLPEIGGIEAIKLFQKRHPQIKIVVVTSLEDEESIIAAVQAGALGYFPKTASRADLLDAIRSVADEVPYLPARIAQKLFKRLRETEHSLPVDDHGETLTSRQNEILALLSEGRSDSEIADILHIAEATVRSHLHHILQRLNLDSRTQAVAYANRQEKLD